MAAKVATHWMQASVVIFFCLAEAQPASAASETVRNYYDTLNVERTATDSQIKKSFRRLAVRYHPDKNKSADAETTFREIAEAYSVLSDKEKRRLYDHMGHEAFLQKEASVDPDDEDETSFPFSFSDFFRDFDDDPFVEEPHFHWSVLQEEEYFTSFEGPNFSFSFEYEDENEEETYY
ncbi:dnaJ homolog subfamily B member 9-like [Melanotaenia boesemani]|uniref:dnaJ homolog subfamily B member 9-like n=1 Tax=Melanotaenia boesemani TaxID=1250792 RepID=UPI001C03CAB7|nr:dnaJ homolog subfamily B member 9-like [Melanotaenia boesemani]